MLSGEWLVQAGLIETDADVVLLKLQKDFEAGDYRWAE